MTEKDKYLQEIEKKLASESTQDILKTIAEIRSTGKPSVIPLIIALLQKNQENEISKEVISLLGQLRNKEAIPYIIEEVKSQKNANFKASLIMTCWQSGLDYSNHILTFAEEFIRGNFQVAIEAFSVIEEWIHSAPKQDVLDCKKHLIEGIDRISKEKKEFYHELVKLIEGYL